LEEPNVEEPQKERISPAKVKVILAVLALFFLAGTGFIGWKFWDYKENNPKFCVTCHLMTPAYAAWEKSEHAGINCHECHHLSLIDQNRLLISFVFKRPSSVPPRHGKTIVPWKSCHTCHWEKNAKYPNAPKITGSNIHARHFFEQQIECTKCHGYQVHKFTPEPRFCVKCHQGKEVHGAGMEGLACLNCHTDRTMDLRPDRAKCLYCHGSERVRKELTEAGTVDVRHYQPDPALVKRAIKIKTAEGAPMQFYCYECHKPHGPNIRPGKDRCLNCHGYIPKMGKHPIHVDMMKMECKDCHKPHIWRVTPEIAKKECVKCHEYRDPMSFF
jgi:nitrate/TMAO reductase-like tetraheme cytochrome c subunit